MLTRPELVTLRDKHLKLAEEQLAAGWHEDAFHAIANALLALYYQNEVNRGRQ